MSHEDPNRNIPEKLEIGSPTDYMNTLDAVKMIVSTGTENLDLIPEQLVTYEEYVRSKNARPELLSEISPNLLKKLDNIIAEFNAERNKMVQEKDIARLEHYWQRMNDLIRNQK